jgi:hypothetical protein
MASIKFRTMALGLGVFALFTVATAVAQDRGDYRGDRDRVARLDPGTTVPVRVSQSIDVNKGDNRVYTGTVDADVTGDNGRIVVPRGATVEMMVRYEPDNDLNLDLESIVVNGQRYAVKTEEKHLNSERDYGLVGSIVGAINGGEARGRAVRIPRDSVVTFRLVRPLDVGVTDRGVERDGYHYHDWYGDRNR